MPSLTQLAPGFRRRAQVFFSLVHQYDPSFRVTSARRTYAEQARLYADYLSGRQALPAVPPGTSDHELGLAFDMARPGVDPYDDELLAEAGEAWRDGGWGRWSPTDPVHFAAPRRR